LRRQAPERMRRTEISALFQRNKAKDEIDRALDLLVKYRRVRRDLDRDRVGRPIEWWSYEDEIDEITKEAAQPVGPSFVTSLISSASHSPVHGEQRPLPAPDPAGDVLATPLKFVTVEGGLTLPLPAINLAVDLKVRGIVLAIDGEHELIVPNDPRLTAADRDAIHRWRRHLVAILLTPCPAVGVSQ
jgi:hypothetical protein